MESIFLNWLKKIPILPKWFKSLKSNGQLDFSDPNAVLQLSQSLLRRDFGLSLVLPFDRLCPPVPNRLNYILWVQSLLETTDVSSFLDQMRTGVRHKSNSSSDDSPIIGIDIGTGASCIYPLIGCVLRSRWQFFGTDIDDKSIQHAQLNVERNKLGDRINIVKVDNQDPLIPLQALGQEQVNFTMCNPPFYESREEMLKSAQVKKRPPFTACTGAEVEMITAGGEVTFVSRIIDESLILKNRIQWYSSMIGKLSSLSILREKLKMAGIDNFALTEFVQGNKTKRWAIAWSFNDIRPTVEVARGVNNVPKSLLPFPSQYRFRIDITSLVEIGQRVNAFISQLPLEWMWHAQSLTGLGFSEKDVWSRAARRKYVTHGQQRKDHCVDIRNMSFGFEVLVQKSSVDTNFNQVTIRWTKGHDAVIFESFCGMLKSVMDKWT
ncbi:U6 small nuclear RNA -methyltransferase [Golovinomyces cichoracearum]|uniref:U6 small nuclear RNA-methyltransferase n=1 Tax=Golovinomyces cichoracearum TaxID=62708 RepID=A0A420JBA7_9PEZI|nr:U6 small nuclear RNA -methyltransferase [Golovinomyces cichoracearum]